jgi:hypothetical protein
MNLPIGVEGPEAEWHNSINATKQQAECMLAVDLFHWPGRWSSALTLQVTGDQVECAYRGGWIQGGCAP